MSEQIDPAATIELVARTQHELDEALAGAELDPRGPTSLPEWSVGHLLSHLARNADSVVRRLEASARGEFTTQYEGGLEGRARQIELGAGRSYGELVDDVAQSSAAVLDAARSMPDDAWDVETQASFGDLQPARLVLFRRVREVVVHHTDLDIGFPPARWPDEVCLELIDEAQGSLANRSTVQSLAAWLIDRGPAPTLAPWG